ncbi:hypothetical protein Y1Q_0021235 [Alligator mississippiensis]|uniref:Uncharacterized protein n=1 Tax=Alligator mississippiensis TaxID=8496 RepID=A0A151MS00_ALLMI|nr:hypothetical protein Y1Q_0021235 [Alligator mississippiensis]
MGKDTAAAHQDSHQWFRQDYSCGMKVMNLMSCCRIAEDNMMNLLMVGHCPVTEGQTPLTSWHIWKMWKKQLMK